MSLGLLAAVAIVEFACQGILCTACAGDIPAAISNNQPPDRTRALPTVVDLRPAFDQFGLERSRQGSRPTCSAFTVAGAIEFAAAKREGHGTRLSVEFLNWAANKTCGDAQDGGFFSDLWRGFEAHGICTAQQLAYQSRFNSAEPPPPEAVAEARTRLGLGLRLNWIKQWNVHTGLTDAHLLAIKKTLNDGWPVCGGFRWPKKEQWVDDVLQMCPSNAVRDGHSVLLVGYRDETAPPGGGVFIFRNTAGAGRDGFMPYGYAKEYMNDAAWIEFEPAAQSRSTTSARVPAAPETKTAPLREQAIQALRRGVEFFRKEVAVEGTYLWQYSEDLTKREGEGKATASQGWVQPPGTPSVGLAFLEAYQATGDSFFLEAVRETAHGLARGQLRSGGWTYTIDFSPEGRRRFAYRDGGKPTGRNTSTLDDNTTQTALRFLLRMAQVLHYEDARIQDTLHFALDALLQAQYPNGAWPQGFDLPPEPDKFPVKKASYPESWPREWPGSGQYWFRYTLNDNALADTIDLMFEAGRILGDPKAGAEFNQLARRCRAAAEKAGDFLLLAQMPEPQPAWAQQYDFDMHPSWARKFEPPAVTGGESQGVLRMLLNLYRETGQRKYLEPIPRALAYFRRSRLDDGRLARFYELKSNRPLYFTRDYQLTYSDADLPTHYGFKVSDGTAAIAREYDRLVKLAPSDGGKAARAKAPRAGSALIGEVRSVIAAQDDRGRWVEDGRLRYHGSADSTARVIRCATFIRNVETLSRYLAATANGGAK